MRRAQDLNLQVLADAAFRKRCISQFCQPSVVCALRRVVPSKYSLILTELASGCKRCRGIVCPRKLIYFGHIPL